MVHFLTKLKCPITSIRRAMTNLAKSGKLKKTSKYTIGKFGKKEHLWVIEEPSDIKEPGDFKISNGVLHL